MSPRTAYGSLHTKQTARKRHRCGWECGSPIEPGTVYIRSAMPPRTDVNTSPHWWTMPLHGATLYDCPTYAGPGPADPRVEASEDIDAIPARRRHGYGVQPGERVTNAHVRGDRL